jgi:hypothetical protein
MFDVDSLARVQPAYFRGCAKNMQQLLDCFTGQLFDWALALGFTYHSFRIYCIFTQLYYH